jgi:hypothetical protein
LAGKKLGTLCDDFRVRIDEVFSASGADPGVNVAVGNISAGSEPGPTIASGDARIAGVARADSDLFMIASPTVNHALLAPNQSSKCWANRAEAEAFAEEIWTENTLEHSDKTSEGYRIKSPKDAPPGNLNLNSLSPCFPPGQIPR